jgi:hypothetical protein
VGRHDHSLLGPSVPAGDPHGITHYWRPGECPLATLIGLCTLPHLRLGNDSDTICNDQLQRYNIVRFLLP